MKEGTIRWNNYEGFFYSVEIFKNGQWKRIIPGQALVLLGCYDEDIKKTLEKRK